MHDPNVIYLDAERPVKSKALKGLIFFVKAVMYLRKNGVRASVVFSRSTPMLSHLPGLVVGKKKCIVAYSDPPGDSVSSRITGFLAQVFISRNADCIVIPSERMKRYYSGFRTLYLPHFIDSCNTMSRCNRDSVNYYHFGNLYSSRDCRRFLQALRDISQEGGGESKLIVHGFVANDILASMSTSGLNSYIDVRGYLNHLDYIELLNSVTNAVLFDMNIPESPFMPSKLVEYLECGRDITVITTKGSEVEAIAAEHGVRCIYYSDNVGTYKEELRKPFERKPNKFNSSSEFMQARIRALVDEIAH